MHKFLIVALLVRTGYSQLISPCPRFFNYKPRNPPQPNVWHGMLTLLSDTELSGVWLQLILDKQSLQLGNWFGEVVTTDNKEYLIKNPRYRLQANTPYTIPFYIKYNPNETPPQLIMFRLNTKTVCPETFVATKTPTNSDQLIIGNSTTSTPTPISARSEGVPEILSQQTTPPPGDSFFHGDFSLINKNKPNIQEETCGTVIPSPRPLIIDGQPSNEGEFPWHAALYYVKGVDITYFCGASLISKNHLITVAKCATKRKTHQPLDTNKLIIQLGKYYITRFSEHAFQSKTVEKITVHPKYNAQTFRHNIAILKTKSPVEITNYVRPICLWSEDIDLKTVIDKDGTVVGWGIDETGRVTEQLTKAQMPVVTPETCIYAYPDFYVRYTSSETYCAGLKNGTTVCNSDTGGGMVFPKTTSNPNNPTWQLRGLISIGKPLGKQLKCVSSLYIVFTDVAKYLDWIGASLN